jgi:hypothetical protein
MKFAIIKIEGNRFMPAYDSDHEKSKKLKMGEVYEVEVKKPRNYEFHRKFMAMINLVFENQEVFDDFDDLRRYITMKAGWFKKVKTPKNFMYIAKSIKFSKMDNVEFEKLYNACIDVIEEEFCITSEAIEQNIGDFY